MSLRDPDAVAADEAFEAALFASIEYSPIATVITNPRLADNPIVALNQTFCDLTGYQRDEVLGRNCRFLAGPDTDPAAQAVLRDAIARGATATAELLNYRTDGTRFRNAVMIAPIRDVGGELSYFLGSQMDVTGSSDGGRRQRARELVALLTPRQRQVLHQMIQGYRNKQIAATLGIDEKTVKMHRAALIRKMNAATSADAIRIGVEAEL